MELLRESLAGKLWSRVSPGVRRVCAGSRAVRCWNKGADWVFSIITASLLWRLLLSDNRGGAWWKDSLLCRTLTELANLVPTILRIFYEMGRRLFDGSCFVRLVFTLGEQVPACISWLLFAMLTAPYEYWNNLYSFGAVIAFSLLCLAGDIRRRTPRLRMDIVGLWPVLFALMAVFGFVFSNSVTLSFRYLCFHLTGFGLVVLCVCAMEYPAQLLRVVRFAAAGLCISSLYALYQRASGIEVSAVLVDLTVNKDMPGRVFSFFENPNSYAMVLVMLIPLALAMALFGKSVMERVLMAGVTLLSCVTLVMTYARGGYLSLAVSLLVFVLILKPRLAPLLVPIGLAALPLLPTPVYNRILTIFNFSDTSISSRIPVYEATLELIGDYPMTGVGLGNQLLKQMIEKGGYYHNVTPFIHAHDIYLQIAAEMGLFGLLAFLGAVMSAVCRGLRAVAGRTGDPALRGIAAAGVAGLAGILFFGLVDYPWSYPRVMTIFWILFGVTITAARLAGENEENV